MANARPVQSFWGVVVLLDINPNGTVKGARIIHSRGNLSDFSYLHDAKMSHYRPRMVDCKAVEGSYYYFFPYPMIGN